MKRIHSADLIKSVMIVLVIIGHRVFYDWSCYHNPAEGDVPLWLIVFGFFAAMGSIFTYITGLVTSFSVYNQMAQRRNTPKQIVLASLVMFLCLTLISYSSLYFFSGGVYINDEYHYGILTQFIKFGQMQFPGLEMLCLYAAILMILGISGFAVTSVCALLLKDSGTEQVRRNKRVLFGLGMVILVLSAFLPFILEPMMFDAFEGKNYVLAFLLANLVAFDFPIFPLLGFALIGATLGLSLASGEDRKKIRKHWSFFAVGIIIAGLLLAVIFLLQGQLILNFARYVHLGIYVIVTLVLLHRFDFKPEEQREHVLTRFASIRRFGKVTLTIFIIETPLAMILHLIPNIAFPGWDSNLGLVMLFALCNLALWWIALRLWEAKGYRGSFEWVITKIIKILSGKSSDKIKT